MTAMRVFYGKKLMNLSSPKSSLHGIAVDNADGCIYISLNWGKKIVKLNRDYGLVGELTGQEGCQYQYLAVVGDEVIVAERSKNVVMVYKYLKYVRQFGSCGPGLCKNILGVSSDGTGNLYVCDYDRESVHVFSNGGEFLHSGYRWCEVEHTFWCV